MKKIYKKITLFILFTTISCHLYGYDIDISADTLDYNQNHNSISASGNVNIKWQERTIQCDFAEFIFDSKLLIARSNVIVEDETGVFMSDNIIYYYDEEKGELTKASVYSRGFFSHSQKMNRLDKENFSVEDMRISNCDLDEPHTYFRAKRATLKMQNRITLYHPVLYVGKIPIFYLPIITKSLKGGKQFGFDISYEPGHTKEGGVSLKTTISYDFSDSIKAGLFLDYLGAYGFGYGTQFNYNPNNNTKTEIFAYSVYDKISQKDRWAVRPNFYSKIGNNWIIRSQGEFFSDDKFNKTFDRNNPVVMANRPHSYISATRSAQGSNLLLLLDMYQIYINGEFKEQSVRLPSISYILYPKTLFWGIKDSLSLNYEYIYQNTYNSFFYKNTALMTYSLAKDFKLGRRLTLKPSLGFSANWYDLDNNANSDSSGFIKYNASLNTRLRVNQWTDWNIKYSARAVGDKNSLDIDNKRNDYGLEQSNLTFSNYMYLGSRTTIRNSITYDLRDFRVQYNLPRLSPLLSEIIYTPTYNTTIYLKQSQEITQKQNFKSLQLDITIGEIELTYLNLGLFYQDDGGQKINNNFTVGIWLNPKWRFDYTIKTATEIDFSAIDIIRQEFRVYRDMHCYNLGVSWIRTNDGDYGIFFKFDLKTNMPFDRSNIEKFNYDDSSNVFYPWR
jgi:LPS-assembly protein